MDHLETLESQSIYILRTAYREFKGLCMLWSIGKDSTVLLWLVRKAFLGHVPIPILHIDTSYKIPEMIRYRDKLAKDLKFTMMYGQNREALKLQKTFYHKKVDRITCCKLLKTEAFVKTLSGEWPRYKLDLATGKYKADSDRTPFTGVILGIRADEEGSRSKERYFSARDGKSRWHVGQQPPELWDQFKTDFAPGSHVRIHPLLDWTELNVWQYIEREKIPVTPLYFDRGSGKRYRSLGCFPCTAPIISKAKNARDIIIELGTGKLSNVAERSGRAQDRDDGGGLETLRRNGYM